MKSLPQTTGDPPVLTVAGWRIYYSDGSAVSSSDSEWEKATGQGIQAVRVFFDQTYGTWIADHNEIHNRCATFMEDDYYWKVGQEFFSGSAAEIPADLPDGAVKAGQLLQLWQFAEIINRVDLDKTFTRG
jgi:hypothetical protein